MSSPYKYRAFISYSHRDEKWASWLHSAIETYRVPKALVGQKTAFGAVPARISPVFRDRDELPSATDLGNVLTQALHDSACQIVICSPAAARSRWVNEEILTFKRLGRSDRVFCVIVDGEPNAENAEQEAFPEAVRFKLRRDGVLGSDPAEPIAADARAAKDGKYNAKLKIIAGMLGVGLDALKQREHHRRQRRLIAVAAAAVVGMTVTSTLAATAWFARLEAEAQRVRAEAQAETARQTTNFMVELFRVSDPSESLGNTITAREILDRGARRIEFELENEPAIQSTLMDTMGVVYKSLGLYSEARALLERGLTTRQALFGDRHPEVARSQSNIGNVLGRQAEFEAAAAMYEDAIRTLREAPDAEMTDLVSSLFGLAEVRTLQADYAGAETLLREAIDILRPTGEADSLVLARALGQLGTTLQRSGRYEEAEPLMSEALAMGRRLIPGGIHPDIAQNLNNLAMLLYETGRYEETESLFRQSLDIHIRLLGERHSDVATMMNNLGLVLHDLGNYPAAEDYYRRALDTYRASLGEAHPLVAQTLNNLAFVYYDQGDIGRALEFSREVVAISRRAFQGDHPEVAYALQNLARWLVEQGDYDTAEPLLEEALAINRRVLPSGHLDIAITQSGMAMLLLETERANLAYEMAAAASRSLDAALGDDHWRAAWARALEGASLTALQRYEEAEPLLLEAWEVLSTTTGASVAQVDSALRYVVNLYTEWGRFEDAARYDERRVGSVKGVSR